MSQRKSIRKQVVQLHEVVLKKQKTQNELDLKDKNYDKDTHDKVKHIIFSSQQNHQEALEEIHQQYRIKVD